MPDQAEDENVPDQAEDSGGPDQGIVVRIGRIFEESLNISAPAPDVDIIEAALLDSLALVTLLFEIEQEFGLEIPLESLAIDDFRSIAGIARLLTKAASAP